MGKTTVSTKLIPFLNSKLSTIKENVPITNLGKANVYFS